MQAVLAVLFQSWRTLTTGILEMRASLALFQQPCMFQEVGCSSVFISNLLSVRTRMFTEDVCGWTYSYFVSGKLALRDSSSDDHSVFYIKRYGLLDFCRARIAILKTSSSFRLC